MFGDCVSGVVLIGGCSLIVIKVSIQSAWKCCYYDWNFDGMKLDAGGHASAAGWRRIPKKRLKTKLTHKLNPALWVPHITKMTIFPPQHLESSYVF